MDTTPVRGRFEDTVDGGSASSWRRTATRAIPIVCRYRWTVLATELATWEQAFSTDDGSTWETNWVMRGDPGGVSQDPSVRARARLATMRTHDRDRALDLREAIHRTGYYPDVVADGVAAAVAGEDVVSSTSTTSRRSNATRSAGT